MGTAQPREGEAVTSYTIHFPKPPEEAMPYLAICEALPAFYFTTRARDVTCSKCRELLKMGQG